MTSLGSTTLQGSLKDQVVATLKTAILTGELTPDTTYKMGEIAEQLGASRTPVREAVMELESRGLVEIIRSVGFQVVTPSVDDLRDLYEVRVMLEVPAMGRLAGHLGEPGVAEARTLIEAMEDPIQRDDLVGFLQLDKRFHVTLVGQLGNKRLTELVADLREWQRMPGLLTLVQSGHLHDRNREHREIVDAIEDGDRALVEKLTEHHLSLSRLPWAGLPPSR